MQIAIYFLLAGLTLSSVSLLKTYTDVSTKELKRRARSGDELAGLLYKAASYDSTLQIFLWIIIGLGATGFFVTLSRSVSGAIAMLVSLILLWLGFAWLPYTKVKWPGLTLAKYSASPIAWILRKIYPALALFAELTKYWRVSLHTGLFEKEDLLDLLDRQVKQEDSRFTESEIVTARSALTFSDKIIRDIMTPTNKVIAVSSLEQVGPILLTELHDSGHSRFPVYEGKKQSKIVGVLYLRDLVNIRSGGRVAELMSPEVYYMHDEEPLDQALQGFLKAKHHMFLVVNRFEDVVGIVTLEDVLEQVIGRQIDEEFDQYQDSAAVAKQKGKRVVRPKETSVSVETVVESDEQNDDDIGPETAHDHHKSGETND